MRIAVAIGVVAVALAAAGYLLQWRNVNPQYTSAVAFCKRHGGCLASSTYPPEHLSPWWGDPAAVMIAVVGIAVAAGILVLGRR